MRYAYEIPAAKILVDYLNDQIDAAITDICPVVAFFDPMSVDQAHRIIVMVPTGTNDAANPGNAEMQVEIGVKSRWSQKTIKADFLAHWPRLNATREAIFCTDLENRLNTFAPDGYKVNAFLNKRDFSTKIYDSWIYSDTSIRLELMAVALT